MKRLDYLIVHFENYDKVRIPVEDISTLYFNDITTTLYKAPETRQVDYYNISYCVAFSLINPVERLNCRDITSVEVYYEDGMTKEYFVDWNLEDDYVNYYQTTRFSSSGEQQIFICNDQESINDYFEE